MRESNPLTGRRRTWHHAQVKGPQWGTPWHFAEGYRTAIGWLVDGWRRSGREALHSDTVVFPLAFLCRHLLELRLKALFEAALGQDPPRKHGLLELWRPIRVELDRCWPGPDRPRAERYAHLPNDVLKDLRIDLSQPGTRDHIESMLRAFEEADPRSFSFRYPGELPGDFDVLALDQLAGLALQLDQELEAWEYAIDAREEAEAESREEARRMAAEMAEEMEYESRDYFEAE